VEVSLGPGALGDGGVDLLNTLRLLAGGSSDFRNKRVGKAHLLGDLRERLLDLGGALSGLLWMAPGVLPPFWGTHINFE
jgi:hypothetical protein